LTQANGHRGMTLSDLLKDGLFLDGDWVETKDQDPTGDVRLIQLADVGDGIFRNRSRRFLTSKRARELGCTFLEEGDVLIARMPEPIGRACLFPGVGQPAVTAVDVCIARPNPSQASPRWLVKAINSPQFRRSMHAHVWGTTRQRISRRNLGTIPLHVPELSDQEALVRQLEDVDARRTSAEHHLGVARRVLDRFRQSVLAQAYEDAALDVDGNGIVQLASLLAEPLKNGYSARPVPYSTPNRVLTLTATTSGYFDGSHFKFTDETFSDESPYWLRDGDILVQRGNTAEFVGIPALYEGHAKQFLYPDLMIRVRPQAHISPRFLWYMLLAPQVRTFLRERATGSAGNMPKINQSILETAPVPQASDQVRADVVTRLDAALAGADQINSQLQETERTLAALAESILAKCLGYEALLGQVSPSLRESSAS
jgi:type I restriction enzyme, S subunit